MFKLSFLILIWINTQFSVYADHKVQVDAEKWVQSHGGRVLKEDDKIISINYHHLKS